MNRRGRRPHGSSHEETSLGGLVVSRRVSNARFPTPTSARGRKVIKTVTYYLVEVRDPEATRLFRPNMSKIRTGSGIVGARSAKSVSCCTTPRSAGFRRGRHLVEGLRCRSIARTRTLDSSWSSTGRTAAARPLRPAGWRTWLKDRGFDVVTCRDPGGTALGDRLRSILHDRVTVPLSMRAEMLLYMASRAQLVEDVIRAGALGGQGRDFRPVPACQYRVSGQRRRAARGRDRHGRAGGDGGAAS